jgi:hypothetical protein
MTRLLAALVVLLPAAAYAEASGAIDWEKKVIRAKGQGSPDLNAPNIASARLGAERAAKMDALRNIMETLKGVQIETGKTAGQAMSDTAVRAKVEGLARNFRVTGPCTRKGVPITDDPKGEPAPCYYSDGGVELEVEMAIDQKLIDTLMPPEMKKKAEETPAPAPAAPAKAEPTGIVVDATGLKLAPAIAPRILDEAGKEIYGPNVADREKIKAAGLGFASYASDVAQAQKDPRVKDKPLVVKAVKLADGAPSDVIVSKDDADKLTGSPAIAEGRVIIVMK